MKELKYENIKISECEEPQESIYLFNNLAQLVKINNKLNKIYDELKEKKINENKMMKWKYAAICMDKIFFYLAFIGFFISALSTILSIKNLH